MKIAVFSGAYGTFGDTMVYFVIKDWLNEVGITNIVLNPPPEVQVDKVILGGCGIIYDEGVVQGGQDNTHRYYTHIMHAKKQGAKIAGIGLGWQGIPLTTGKNTWVEILNSCEFLTVWNHYVEEYLQNIGITSPILNTSYVGLALKPKGEEFSYKVGLLTHTGEMIAKDCQKPEWKEKIDQTIDALITFYGNSSSLVVVPFIRFFVQDFLTKSLESSLCLYGNPHRVLGALRGVESCITTTLHALLMACKAGCKVLALYPPEPLKPKIRWGAEIMGVERLPITTDSQTIIDIFEKVRKSPRRDMLPQIIKNHKTKQLLQEWIQQ